MLCASLLKRSIIGTCRKRRPQSSVVKVKRRRSNAWRDRKHRLPSVSQKLISCPELGSFESYLSKKCSIYSYTFCFLIWIEKYFPIFMVRFIPLQIVKTFQKTISHSTIFDIPMLPLREDQKYRHRFTSQRRPATAVMVIIPLNFSRCTLIMTTHKNRQVKSSLEHNQIPLTGFSVYETISQKNDKRRDKLPNDKSLFIAAKDEVDSNPIEAGSQDFTFESKTGQMNLEKVLEIPG